MNRFLRHGLVAVVFALVVGLWAWTAYATSGAHFFSATNSVNSSGALVTSFDEAGLGQETVNYTLTVDTATATYACINNGGKHPSASNKETVSSGLTGTAAFTPKNGRVSGSITVGPLSAGTFSCPSGQSLVLARVTYSGILLTDTTNSVSIEPTPDPICRSFSSLFPC